MTLDIRGVCKLKHLGHSSMAAIQTVNVLTGELNNTTTYTAANGDQLTTTFAGTDPLGGDIEFTGLETYTGGTGRFANATGESFLQGSATGATGEFTSKGSITF
ncbi:MAG: hypothetical protein ABIU86_04470 [Gemmatimonadaceae bacterium]